jgi:hypothetical protein
METAAIWEMPVHIGREVMRGGAFIGLAGIVALILGFTHFVMAAEDHQAAISEATRAFSDPIESKGIPESAFV